MFTYHFYTNIKCSEISTLKNETPSHLKRKSTLQMQCLPLYSILKAVGNTNVDFFSLDVEGAEFGIMEAALMQKHEFQFSVATIETAHMDRIENKGSFLEFNYMLSRNGYKMARQVEHDHIYIKK